VLNVIHHLALFKAIIMQRYHICKGGSTLIIIMKKSQSYNSPAC